MVGGVVIKVDSLDISGDFVHKVERGTPAGGHTVGNGAAGHHQVSGINHHASSAQSRFTRGDGHIGEGDGSFAGGVEEGCVAGVRDTIGELRSLNMGFRVKSGDVNHAPWNVVEGRSGNVQLLFYNNKKKKKKKEMKRWKEGESRASQCRRKKERKGPTTALRTWMADPSEDPEFVKVHPSMLKVESSFSRAMEGPLEELHPVKVEEDREISPPARRKQLPVEVPS